MDPIFVYENKPFEWPKVCAKQVPVHARAISHQGRTSVFAAARPRRPLSLHLKCDRRGFVTCKKVFPHGFLATNMPIKVRLTLFCIIWLCEEF